MKLLMKKLPMKPPMKLQKVRLIRTNLLFQKRNGGHMLQVLMGKHYLLQSLGNPSKFLYYAIQISLVLKLGLVKISLSTICVGLISQQKRLYTMETSTQMVFLKLLSNAPNVAAEPRVLPISMNFILKKKTVREKFRMLPTSC